MGKKQKTKKFATVKRLLNPKDQRLQKSEIQSEKDKKRTELLKLTDQNEVQAREIYNPALGPPYRILVDTNFLNFSIQNKIDIIKGSMDCLLGKCIPLITDCVIAELEKLGHRYRIALRITKDPRFEKLKCEHKGTYADDCIVNRVKQHRIFIVGTCDKDLKRRLRKIPGVPIMYIQSHKYTIERMPEAYGLTR